MKFAWQPGNKNYMNQDFIAKPPEYLPAYESRHCISANVGLNSFFFPGFPAEIGVTKKDEEVRTQQRPFFHLRSSPPAPNLYPNEQLFVASHTQDGVLATHELSIPQKRKFFIFDRSGTETRMVLSSLKPPITNPAAKTVSEYDSEQACAVFNDPYDSHEDHITGGEDSEYHEDTEELNALMYSENDDISYNSLDEDEVSTGRSPFTLENGFDDTEHGEDSDNEVTSLARPPKRYKPLSFGSSNKLSSMATKPMEKQSPQLYKDDKQSASFDSSIKHSSMATEPMEKPSPQLYLDEEHSVSFDSSKKLSSMATEPLEKTSPQELQSVSFYSSNKLSPMATEPMEEPSPQLHGDNKQSVRDKIRSKLSVLEYLVPCSKGKDPLVILEETIEYLKYFKANNNMEDKPERRGCCGPRL